MNRVDATSTVQIGFQAKYESIYPDGIDDFVAQLKVMISRTDAGITTGDILGVTVSGSDTGTIVCDVALASDQLVASLTEAVVARHLSVYINRVGYIATIGTKPPLPTTIAPPRSNPFYTVTVVFEADYDAHDLELFSDAINASLIVTKTIGPADLARVIFTKGDGMIYATVVLRSANAAAAVTRRAVASQFRVAVGAATYIAKLSSLPSNSTSTPPTRPVATTLPASTAHPTEHGFIWLNEYTSDNENIMDCSAGHDWSGIVISKMPVGCHRFQHAATKQDEFNFLGLDADTGDVSRFGMICDPQCSSCISQQESGMAFNNCQQTWGGSVSVYPEGGHCLGASYIEINDGALSLFRYSGATCDLQNDPSDTLYIRNYPPSSTGSTASCVADGTTGKFYALTRTTDNDGAVFFTGKMDCTDAECTEGCTKVDSWQEGTCHTDANGKGMKIWESINVLKECSSETGVQLQPAAGKQQEAIVSVADIVKFEAYNNTNTTSESDGANKSSITPFLDIQNNTHASTTSNKTTTVAISVTTKSVGSEAGKELPNESQKWDGITAKDMRTRASVHQTATFSNTSNESYNKQIYALLIAGAGVLGVALVVIGVIYGRKHSVRRTQPEEEDIMRDFRVYAQSNGYSDQYDERLITDI